MNDPTHVLNVPQPTRATPFGPGDRSLPNPARIQQQIATVRQDLQVARAELNRMRNGNSEPRPVTRADGFWPYLLIRSYPGDVGQRPQHPGDLPYQGMVSPDIVVTAVGATPDTRVSDRNDMAAVSAQGEHWMTSGTRYDLWVHVWNLGRCGATGVRVRIRQFQPMPPDMPGPQHTFLGGIGVHLAERTHSVVKVATIAAPTLWNVEQPLLLVATADCFSDPASGDLSPGADRHTALRDIFIDVGPT